MKQRFAVFGDVHGEVEPLRNALDYGKLHADQIVGLGDYVDRGSNTAGVLDLLVKLTNEASSDYIFLKGNHEIELLRFIDTGDISRFSAFGGLETIGSYVDSFRGNVVEEFRRAFPASHRLLIESMPCYFETEDYLFSHIGFDPSDPRARDERSMVLGSFHELFRYCGAWPRELVISGHYPQRSGVPFESPNFISIDTGCGTFADGKLTLLMLPSREVIQFGVGE